MQVMQPSVKAVIEDKSGSITKVGTQSIVSIAQVPNILNYVKKKKKITDNF